MKILFFLPILFFLLIFSAFFAASETAFMTLSMPALAQLKNKKKKNAILVEKLKNKSETFLATVLIGTNLVNNFFSSLSTMLFAAFFPHFGAFFATIFSTILIVLFGEILPKTAATFKNEKVVLLFALPIRAIQILLFPIVTIFDKITIILKKIFAPKNEPFMTKDELKTVLEKAFDEKTIDFNEKLMLEKIIFFKELRLKSIATHLSQIYCIDEESDFETTRNAFCETGFSRIPVAKDGDALKISGVVEWKDLLFYGKSKKNFAAKKCAKEALFVPESKMVASLFYTFRAENEKIAVLVNEHGAVSGIVTLNDIVQAVLSKTDATENNIFVAPDGTIFADGEISLIDFEAQTGIALKSEFFTTLAGFLLEKLDKMPRKHDKIETENHIFFLDNVVRNKIECVQIVKKSNGRRAN